MKHAPDILRENGLKATNARIAIVELFLSETRPLNAEYISKSSKLKNIDQVTVYRTLASLLKSGMIRNIDLRKSSAYYELSQDHHHHIVCTKCGILEHIEGCEVQKISEKLLSGSKKFKTVLEHSFELFGLCNKCL